MYPCIGPKSGPLALCHLFPIFAWATLQRPLASVTPTHDLKITITYQTSDNAKHINQHMLSINYNSTSNKKQMFDPPEHHCENIQPQ